MKRAEANVALKLRAATLADVAQLAGYNSELIQDEGHRNPMTLSELAERMRNWLQAEYRAVLFEQDGQVVGYALYCRGEQFNDEFIFLRQFLVRREFRRRGIGREAMRLLQENVWPSDSRVVLDVLAHNEVGRAFWASVGFKEHSLTLLNRPWMDQRTIQPS